MKFTGQLLLPDEPGPGLRVNLDVAEHHLAVESDSGDLGAWPLEVVDVERLHSDVFVLTVAGEPLRFLADDSVSFAYTGMPSIDSVTRQRKARSVFRSMLEWIRDEPAQEDAPAERSDTSTPAVEELPGVDDGPTAGVPADLMSTLIDDTVEISEIELDRVVEQAAPEGRVDVSIPPIVSDGAEDVRCPAVRSDGRRCESSILTSSGYCYPHDPKRSFEDKYEAAQEARVQLRRDATERLNRVYGRLEKAMRQVERGELDPEKAMAMAQLARTMCAILDMDEPEADNPR